MLLQQQVPYLKCHEMQNYGEKPAAPLGRKREGNVEPDLERMLVSHVSQVLGQDGGLVGGCKFMV